MTMMFACCAKMSKIIFYYLLLLGSGFNGVKCDKQEDIDILSKNGFPYFRRKVEEVLDDTSSGQIEESNNKLVSVLVDNANEIFTDKEETSALDAEKNELQSTFLFRPTISEHFTSEAALTTTVTTNISETTPVLHKSVLRYFSPIRSFPYNDVENTNVGDDSTTIGYINTTDELLTYEAAVTSRTLLINMQSYGGGKADTDNIFKVKGSTSFKKPSRHFHPMHSSRDILLLGAQHNMDLVINNNFLSDDILMYTTVFEAVSRDKSKRSCIMCNNVGNPVCSNPKNTLIQSKLCNKDDICYSQHTPFGIVDRGCFNSMHNMTTYVCACNLCNYISIKDMPIMFATKYEWIANVYDLARQKRLKKSVFKEMSCLQCEVNKTDHNDLTMNSNCLEGHIPSLKKQQCLEDEICAVKVIKSLGYVWRGCVSSPLYNYYMTTCDTDLCNYDPIVSVYDTD